MAYDSTATKERILTAAASEFAAHGVAGARVDRIAASAQANKRAIYDYFGDKDGLFTAVLERLLADLAEAVPPGDDDLASYAERLFDHHRDHPEGLRLLLWEALERGDQPVPGEDARRSHYEDKVRAVRTAEGDEGDEDPRTRLFLALGLVGWSLAMPQVRRMVLGPDEDLDRLRTDISRAVRALPRPEPRPDAGR